MMDSVLIHPQISNKSDSNGKFQLTCRKSGKDLVNQQRSPLMVYERAAVFLQQIRPNRNSSISDQVTKSSEHEKQGQYHNPNLNRRSHQDRINEIISNHETQKEKLLFLENNSYSNMPPPSMSSGNESSSLTDYPGYRESPGDFRKSPSSISIHSQKITHYEMLDCPLPDNIYSFKDQDPMYGIYDTKLATSMLPVPRPLPAPISATSIQTKLSESERLRSGSNRDLNGSQCRVQYNGADTEYRIIGLISTVAIFAVGKILSTCFTYMDSFKQAADRVLIKCCVDWDLISIFRKDKCNTMNLIVFGPIMAVMGVLYSIFWIFHSLCKLMLSPTPSRFLEKFNFDNVYGRWY